MRGTGVCQGAAVCGCGITPARAGNRSTRFFCGRHFGDHPRACGEQVCPCVCSLAPWGSPPRVRGTVLHCTHNLSNDGITPARAGNSDRLVSADSVLQDHPRACGEQSPCISLAMCVYGSPPRVRGTEFLDCTKTSQTGSPPRVRGTVHTPTMRYPMRRITPARAGNSLCSLFWLR